MKSEKIHIIPVIFGGLLALPLILIVALQLWQIHLQKEAKEKLESSFLQTITVPSEEVVWEKKNKEVNIKGELFDVKSFVVKNGNYILTGLFDVKETAVKNLLQKQGGSFGVSLLQLLVVIQGFVTCVVYLFNFSLSFSFKKKYSFFRNNYTFCFKDLLVPPPKYQLVLFR